MGTELTLVWLLTLTPLTISPGPANILFAASGSAFGLKQTLPFYFGTNLVCLLQTLAIGLGLGVVLTEYPQAVVYIKALGVTFILVLAWMFFRLSIRRREVLAPLRFRDGVVVELLNIKFLMIPTIMFSQFYTRADESLFRLMVLTLALTLLTLASNLAWVIGGEALTRLVSKDRVQKIQGPLFALVLCITAFWLAIG